MNTPEPKKVYVVLSVSDLRRMIKHIKATSRPHIKGKKEDFGLCTGVFRSTLSEKPADGEHRLDSYKLSRA